MAELTIRIPRAHVAAVRTSLLHVRAGLADAIATADVGGEGMGGLLVELRDAEHALGQLVGDAGAGEEPVALAAHPELLSDALHGALADAIEAFERACAADWRGTAGEPAPGEALQRLLGLFTLFEDVQGRGR
jgi:hypothetical protein